ncbi:small integral membrane protein 20 [Xyrichtys novacula]|uniref:Small integral membrane protein 20 n=1 Tax=Xyrichtys novacula TaxID=13765 RepID=A0AAV1HJK5_XYRNO|nr:small integral membrane protein 20 [Xyrichtys novacula]
MSKNKKIALIFGGFVTAIAAAFYPIFFYPLTHKDEYRHVQKMNRTGINQADIQPVGVKMVRFLKVALKSFTAPDLASTFGPHEAPCQQNPTARASNGHSPSQPPNQQAPLFMRGCYCWATFRNKRKLKSLAELERSKVKRAKGERGPAVVVVVVERRRWGERRKFLSFPAGVFQIPQATASRQCE